MSASALASASAAAFFGSPPLPPPPAPPTAAYARQWLYALALASLMFWRGRRKGSLSRDGAAAAFAVGLVSCAASVRLGLTLIAFFVTASRLTKVGAARKRELEDGHTEGGNRNWVQVAANGGLGTLLAAAYHASTRARGAAPEQPLDAAALPLESALQAAYLCHYAACNADTWASELGVLSKAKPRLVTAPWRHVPPGTNGGVSALGNAASAAGGLLIGAVFWGLGALLVGEEDAAAAPAQWPLVVLGAAAGALGSLIDSLLGATLQYSGWCSKKQLVVNAPTPTSTRICGYDVLTNSQVNFLASVITSAAGALAATRLF